VVTAPRAGALSLYRIHLPLRHFATSQGDVCAERRGVVAGLFCKIPYLRLSCRDEPMMNQPVNVERNQHGLDIGLHLPRFLRSRR
jgi:hypothetical protein